MTVEVTILVFSVHEVRVVVLYTVVAAHSWVETRKLGRNEAEVKEGTVANKATKNEWTNMTVQDIKKKNDEW